MEIGYLLGNMHGGSAPTAWIDGPPERSFWAGLRLKGHRRLPLKTYRCTRCGYLESYAPSA
jgi:hypothetical protein